MTFQWPLVLDKFCMYTPCKWHSWQSREPRDSSNSSVDIIGEVSLQSKLNQEKSAPITLEVWYYPILPSFHLTTKRHLCILHTSEQLLETLWHSPLIAFRQPRNLTDLWVCTTLSITPHELSGNHPCGVPRCKTCPIVMATDEFSNHIFKVKFSASCKSSNVP